MVILLQLDMRIQRSTLVSIAGKESDVNLAENMHVSFVARLDSEHVS
jgi:hypothetical protein